MRSHIFLVWPMYLHISRYKIANGSASIMAVYLHGRILCCSFISEQYIAASILFLSWVSLCPISYRSVNYYSQNWITVVCPIITICKGGRFKGVFNTATGVVLVDPNVPFFVSGMGKFIPITVLSEPYRAVILLKSLSWLWPNSKYIFVKNKQLLLIF